MARPSLQEQAVTDCAQQFDAALPWVTTATYDGVPDIPVQLSQPEDAKPLAGRGQADEITILVRKVDVPTFAKNTPVIVDGASYKIVRRIGGGYLNHELLLRTSLAPNTRRPLP